MIRLQSVIPITGWKQHTILDFLFLGILLLLLASLASIILMNIPNNLPVLRRWYLRWVQVILKFEHHMPESVLMIIIGIIVGLFLLIPPIAKLAPPLINISSQMLYLLLIPPIILEVIIRFWK